MLRQRRPASRNCVMPPTRGASGWMMSTARPSISSRCSRTLASISPVAMGVSSAAASCAWPSTSYASSGSSIQVRSNSSSARPIRMRGGAVPLLVGVDHQRDVVAEMLADALRRGEVDRAVGLAHLDLDAADAAASDGSRVLQDLLDRGVEEPARGVVARHRVAVRAEELGQREAGALGLQVPQRDVERGDGLGGDAAATDRGAGPEQLGPEPADVVRVLAEQLAARPRVAWANCAGPPARLE